MYFFGVLVCFAEVVFVFLVLVLFFVVFFVCFFLLVYFRCVLLLLCCLWGRFYVFFVGGFNFFTIFCLLIKCFKNSFFFVCIEPLFLLILGLPGVNSTRCMLPLFGVFRRLK